MSPFSLSTQNLEQDYRFCKIIYKRNLGRFFQGMQYLRVFTDNEKLHAGYVVFGICFKAKTDYVPVFLKKNQFDPVFSYKMKPRFEIIFRN